MNVVIDLASVKFNRTNQHDDSAVRFVTACLEMNRDMIISTIKSMPTVDITYILETITYQLLASVFSGKSHQTVLEALAGGSIFKLKDLLLEEFRNDTAISEAIQAVERGDVAF